MVSELLGQPFAYFTVLRIALRAIFKLIVRGESLAVNAPYECSLSDLG